MKNFIIFDKNTGKIKRTGSCPESMVSIQASGLNEKVIEGKADDSKEKIVNGQVVLKTFEDLYVQKEVSKPDFKEALIRNKMNTLLRKMAIDELKKEGKIE